MKNKTIVIKYGGSAIGNQEVRKTILEDIVELQKNNNVVLVHGGGPEINAMLERLQIKSHFVNGLRYTDANIMEVVEMVLSGKVNKQIVSDLQTLKTNAIGISGRDGGTFKVKKITSKGEDIGFVGEITSVDTILLEPLIKNKIIPVVSPVGDIDGLPYNINADYAAVAVAKALHADELIFMTDVKGIMTDFRNPDTLIKNITVSEINNFIADGTISGGMIPKVECCIAGVNANIPQVRIIDGRVEHCLAENNLANSGTLITK